MPPTCSTVRTCFSYSELTIRSVVNNRMLYQEGWGVDSIKHSLTYSGGKGRTLTEWLDDVELLQGDLDRASAVVAEKIVEEVFLLVPFPSERKR